MNLPVHGLCGNVSGRIEPADVPWHLFEVGFHEAEPEVATAFLLHERLSVLREMLGSMSDATPLGRGYLTNKIVNLLRNEALRPNASFTVGERELVNRCLEDLEHELGQIAPDIEAFDARARTLIEILSLA